MYTICSGIENRTSNVQIFHVSISVSTLCAVMIYEARSPTPRLCSPAPFLRLSQWRRVFWLLHSVLFTAHCNSLYFYALCLNLSQRTLRLCTLKACTLTSCTRTQSFVHSDPISYPCANSDPRALPWNQYTHLLHRSKKNCSGCGWTVYQGAGHLEMAAGKPGLKVI